MNVSLQNLLESGQLSTHKTSKSEIAELLKAVDRDLTDSQLQGLSADRQFATAYSAALLVATLALAASGYRAQQEGHHYWTIQSLTFTLKLNARLLTNLTPSVESETLLTTKGLAWFLNKKSRKWLPW